MNPYRVVDPTDVLWRRVGAFALDVTITTLLAAVAGVLFGWLFGTAVGVFAYLAVGLAWWLFASVVLQGQSGATPGKRLCGLCVVDADGRPCGTHAALLRTLAWPIDGFPYILPAATAFAAAMSSHRAQRIGDRMARTYVIDNDFVGLPPVAVALPRRPDLGLEPYEVRTFGDYLPAGMTIPQLKALRNQAGAAAINAGSLAPGSAASIVGGRDRHELPENPAEPRWDPERRAYVRYNAVRQEWMTFDETRREWVAA